MKKILKVGVDYYLDLDKTQIGTFVKSTKESLFFKSVVGSFYSRDKNDLIVFFTNKKYLKEIS